MIRRLINRFRGKPPSPPAPRPPLNEDWQRGDLACCVSDFYDGSANLPSVGTIYRVIDVFPGIAPSGRKGWGLCLSGMNPFPLRGYDATAFRKVRPDAEPCEAEFKELIRRPAKQPKRVDA